MKLFLRVGFSLTIFAIFHLVAVAAESSADERKKRKIVSRLYQITDAALEQCPSVNKKNFEKTLTQFRAAYPELILLVNRSIYLQPAIERYADDIQAAKTWPVEEQSKSCAANQALLNNMIVTEEGKKSITDIIEVLKN